MTFGDQMYVVGEVRRCIRYPYNVITVLQTLPDKLYNTRLDPLPLNQRAVKTHCVDTYYISCSKNVTPVIYTTNRF